MIASEIPIVTTHAVERGRMRFRLGLDAHAVVTRDVAAALAEGRVSRSARPWISLPGRRKKTMKGTRFAWTVDRRRVYIVGVSHGRPCVVTCFQGQP